MPHPVLNEREALHRVMDRDFLKELLQDFSAMRELDWNIFESKLTSGDFAGIEIISHSIKGVSGNLSLIGIYHASTALNDAIRVRNQEGIRQHLEAVKFEVERFRSFLSDYLAS